MKKLFGEKSKPRTFLNALVVFVLIFVFFICILLTACDNKIDKDKTNKTPTQNEQTGGNQGGQENQGSQTGENQGSQTGGNQGSQTGGNQGGQTGGNQGGETPNPEKTPAEYKAECEQKIVKSVHDYIYKSIGRGTLTIDDYKLNLENGKIYTNVTYTYRNPEQRFYTMDTNLTNLTNASYKEISAKLDNLQLSNRERNTKMDASELGDKYNALCNYVLSQCDLQDSEILNVTKFATTGEGTQRTNITVLRGNKVYILEACTHSAPSSDQTYHIDYMLNSETNEISLVSQESFKDFDNIVSAEG